MCLDNKTEGPYTTNPCVPALQLLSPRDCHHYQPDTTEPGYFLLCSTFVLSLFSSPGKSTPPWPLDKKGVGQKQDWIIKEVETEKEEE